MPTQPAGVLGEVIAGLIAYRGHGSPEALARSYAPERPPYSGSVVRKIMDGTDPNPDEPLKLMRVSGMLRVPPRTLDLVKASDAEGLARLDWKGETDVAQFVIETVRAAANPPRNRRSSDRKRAAG